jgi:hypothetical protein
MPSSNAAIAEAAFADPRRAAGARERGRPW